MQLQRNDLSPEAIRVIENMPKVELERLLGIEQQGVDVQYSKWAKVAEEAKALNISHDVGEHIRKCSKEFKEDFAFKHDLIDEK